MTASVVLRTATVMLCSGRHLFFPYILFALMIMIDTVVLPTAVVMLATYRLFFCRRTVRTRDYDVYVGSLEHNKENVFRSSLVFCLSFSHPHGNDGHGCPLEQNCDDIFSPN